MNIRIVLSIALASLTMGQSPAGEDVGAVETLELDSTLTGFGRQGGVAVDRLGFLYVANFAERVWKISPGGEVVALADALYGASGNAIDGRGNLLQSGFFDNTVRHISRSGELIAVYSDNLNGPVGIHVDPRSGAAYVCNCPGNNVVRITPAGVVEEFATSDSFSCPNGITADPEGNLYVVSFNNDVMVRIGPDGTTTDFAVVEPAGGYSEQLLALNIQGNAHIAFAQDNFFVTKIKMNQIYRVDRQGNAFHFAGTGAPGADDGPPASATLARPNGIAAFGNTLYVNMTLAPWFSTAPSTILVRKITLPATFE